MTDGAAGLASAVNLYALPVLSRATCAHTLQIPAASLMPVKPQKDLMSLVAAMALLDGGLAARRASLFERKSSRLTALLRVVRLAPVYLHLQLLDGMLAATINRHTRRFVDDALWFRGMRAELEERIGASEIDPEDRLRMRLQRVEAGVAAMLADAERMAEPGPRHRALRTMAAAQGLRQALLDLRGEVRRFIGAIQAHDANVFAMRQVIRVCSSSDELVKALEDATS